MAFERTGGCSRCAFEKVCLSVVDCAGGCDLHILAGGLWGEREL